MKAEMERLKRFLKGGWIGRIGSYGFCTKSFFQRQMQFFRKPFNVIERFYPHLPFPLIPCYEILHKTRRITTYFWSLPLIPSGLCFSFLFCNLQTTVCSSIWALRSYHNVQLENETFATDKYSRPVLVSKEIHILIHVIWKNQIHKYLDELRLNKNTWKN